MQSTAATPEEYITNLPEERKEIVSLLHHTITDNLPSGFQATMGYGMLSYVVPHSIYPAGYHCNTEHPLPFMSLASQKNFIAVYHMGIYVDPKLMNWFLEDFSKFSKSKLDMGKSCIRFKKMNDIPFELIGALASKMTVAQWIDTYESVLKRAK